MLPRARDAESVLARARSRHVLRRAAALLGCAFALSACDVILGIEDHSLAEGGASPPPDGSHDAGTDAKADSGDDSEASQCDEGLNSVEPPVDCEQGTGDAWFASPYAPKADLTVERIEVHYETGSVALLTSVGGLPGDVLFMGAITAIGTAGWAGADVSPPLPIRAGVDYFLAFEGGCSFGQGPAAIEFAATTLAGPWSADGDDIWTARVIGKCGQ
jgi:hypothetical protein